MQPKVKPNNEQKTEPASEKKMAVQLLVQAAKPEKQHVLLGILFLFLASGLEA